MRALAAAPFGRRPGLSELLQQPRRAKPHAWGPGGRGLSPGHAGMGEAEVTPMLQPTTERPARPKSSGASSQPPLREENPIHLQGKGLEPVSAPRPDPCGVPDPAPGCRSRPHTAFGATPGSAHPPSFCAPLPPARPKPSRPSCSANSLLLCPLPPRCPLSLLPAFTSLSPKTSPFLAPRLAKICLAAPRLPQQEGLSAGELFPDPKKHQDNGGGCERAGSRAGEPLKQGGYKAGSPSCLRPGGVRAPGWGGGRWSRPPAPNPTTTPTLFPSRFPAPSRCQQVPLRSRGCCGRGAGRGAGLAVPSPSRLLLPCFPPSLPPSIPPSAAARAAGTMGCCCRLLLALLLLLPAGERPGTRVGRAGGGGHPSAVGVGGLRGK